MVHDQKDDTGERNTMNRHYRRGAIFVGIGLGLLVGRLRLDSLTPYPGGGAEFIPFHAAVLAFASLLFVVAGSVIGASKNRRYSGNAVLLAVAGLSAAAYLLWTTFGLVSLGEPPSGTTDGLVRTTTILGVLAGGFLVVGGITGAGKNTVVTGLIVGFGSAVIGAVEWRFDPLLGPVLDVWFLLTGNPILEIPYVGSLLVLAIIALGGWLGWVNE